MSFLAFFSTFNYFFNISLPLDLGKAGPDRKSYSKETFCASPSGYHIETVDSKETGNFFKNLMLEKKRSPAREGACERNFTQS